jgi:hypothetical protein
MIYTGTGIIDSSKTPFVDVNYVAGVGPGTFYYSSDGFTWFRGTSISGLIFAHTGQMAWNGSYWLCGGYASTAPRDKVLAKSVDGINWTVQSSPHSGCTQVAAIIWDGTKWVIGTNSGIYTSTDGDTWTQRYSLNTVTDIIYTGSIYFSLGLSFSTVAYSYNGIDWTALPASAFGSPAAGTPRAIVWNGVNYWLGVENTTTGTFSAYRSSDGFTWSSSASSTSVFQNSSGFGGIGVLTKAGIKVFGFGEANSPNRVGELSTLESVNWVSTVPASGSIWGTSYKVNVAIYDGTKLLSISNGLDPNILTYSYNGKDWYPVTKSGFTSFSRALQAGGLASKFDKSINPQF